MTRAHTIDVAEIKSVFLFSGVVLSLLVGSGCATLGARPVSAPQGDATQGQVATDPGPQGPAPTPTASAAALIEEALHGRGLQFGTDGSVEALLSYTKTRHQLVPHGDARVGDIVFFNTTFDREHCGSHAGIIEDVRDGGALTFREYRGGKIRRSVVDFRQPRARRDASGHIVNTFLRSKHPSDPDGALYFAGEMLCAVGRVSAAR